jgi:hypothetical protein
MNSASWASYQSPLPPETRAGGERDDDEQAPGRHDHEPPRAVYVEWFADVPCRDFATGAIEWHQAPVSRWFPAERWAWKHAVAWRDAMAKRHGAATIEEDF